MVKFLDFRSEQDINKKQRTYLAVGNYDEFSRNLELGRKVDILHMDSVTPKPANVEVLGAFLKFVHAI